MKTLVIVGGGFSGAALAVQALRHWPASAEGVRLVLIDRSADMARGLAYGTPSAQHLLNVPAGNMSALADEPDDFLHFCQRQTSDATGATFVSRSRYGDYLAELLQRSAQGAACGVELQQRVATVRALHPGAHGVTVELDGAEPIQADHVVLAFGHFLPTDPPGLSVARLGSSRYCANPWQGDALAGLSSDDPVLLVGSGLTALDVALALLHQGHRGEIVMLSRRGLLPLGHRLQRDESDRVAGLCERLLQVRSTTAALTRHIRREIAACTRDGGDWRDVIAALRPITPLLWQRLPAAERRRFLRHVQPYWDVHRHRVAPTAYQVFQQALADGRLKSIAGRLVGVQPLDAGGVGIELRRRGSGDTTRLSVARVINCTGPNLNLARISDPLVSQLREAGIVCPDAQGLGLEVDTSLAARSRDGEVSARLSYIGPMLKADFWEAIAVPELRWHALSLALRLHNL